MDGSLNDILPETISSHSEEIIKELVQRKMTSAARLAVDMLHAMEERFGTDAQAEDVDLSVKTLSIELSERK